MQRFILLIFATFALMAVPANAAGATAEMWRVSQKSGDVRVIHNRLQPAAARIDAALSPGDVVMTGPTGRATLTRGGDYIVLAPSSRLLLPANTPTGMTSLIQEMGTMLFKVRRTGIPHFRVDTPMLAAVVKGTTFTVIVGPDRSAVQVIEGAVEVSAVQGGMARLVEGGKTVFIAKDNPSSLITADPTTLQKTSGTDVSIKLGGTGDVDLATVANLSDGLVRADVTAAVAKPTVAVVPAGGSVVTAVAGVADGVVADVTDSASVSPVLAGVADVTTAGTGIVQTAVTPVVSAAASIVPAVVDAVAPVLGALTPTITAPILGAVAPTIIAPVLGAVAPVITAPVITAPVITAPVITAPVITAPVITAPVITAPVITAPVITAPVITAPVITAPVITIPVITTPVITTPVITVPTVPCIVCR